MKNSVRMLAVVAVIGLVATSCGGTRDTGFPPPDATPPTATTPTDGGGGDHQEVQIGDNFFEPKEITVKAGTTVEWSNDGQAQHSVTADDGSFDSSPKCVPDLGACLQSGDTFEFTFSEPGSYPYYCRVHGGPNGAGQAGVVTVEA